MDDRKSAIQLLVMAAHSTLLMVRNVTPDLHDAMGIMYILVLSPLLILLLRRVSIGNIFCTVSLAAGHILNPNIVDL